MGKDLVSRGSKRSARLLFASCIAIGTFASPARSQVAGVDADLAALLTRLTSLPSTATIGDRLTHLDDIAVRLLAPDGILSDLSAEVGDQGRLLDLRAADLASLRVDLSDLRAAVDLGGQDGTDLTDLRNTVGTHATTLARHESRIDQDTTDIATLSERNVAQGHEIARLNGRVEEHGTRITALETAVDEGWDAQNARIDGLGRRLDAQVDRLDDRIDTANEGVAMALALKSPYVADDKTFALSGGWGTFEGANAFGMSGAVRANQYLQLDAGLAIGAGNGSVGGRAGATLTW